jgi:hypothetical protein
LLLRNAGAWNRRNALLFIDQPIGAGFSLPGQPSMAAHHPCVFPLPLLKHSVMCAE